MTDKLDSYHKNKLGGKNLKLWDANREFDKNAITQLENVASLPITFKHVAGMPDVHLGYGACVGSVIANKKRNHPFSSWG